MISGFGDVVGRCLAGGRVLDLSLFDRRIPDVGLFGRSLVDVSLLDRRILDWCLVDVSLVDGCIVGWVLVARRFRHRRRLVVALLLGWTRCRRLGSGLLRRSGASGTQRL